MRTLALFAHFDADGAIQPYVEHHLRALRAVAGRLVLVSTAALSPATRAYAAGLADRVLVVPNVGYDFAMWRAALAGEDVRAWERLLLTNSSVFGPLTPLAPILAQMEASGADFWGMTECREIAPHLQSYFLVFARAALHSRAFADFWREVEALSRKEEVIRRYEVGLTLRLRAAGLVGRAFVDEQTVPAVSWPSRLRRLSRCINPTLTRPAELVRAHMPYVKVALLERNPARVALDGIYAELARAGFSARLLTPRALARAAGG